MEEAEECIMDTRMRLWGDIKSEGFSTDGIDTQHSEGNQENSWWSLKALKLT